MSGTIFNPYFQDHCEVTQDESGTVSFFRYPYALKMIF